MTGGFDPYSQWLGIPPHEQPPHYYRLLGVQRFESDLNVVSNAVERQTVYLKTLLASPHAAEAQKLLNEVAAARAILLNAETKQAYDAQLRAALSLVAASSPPSAASAAATAPSVGPVVVEVRPSRDGSAATLATALLGVAAGVALAVFLLPRLLETAGRPQTDSAAVASSAESTAPEATTQSRPYGDDEPLPIRPRDERPLERPRGVSRNPATPAAPAASAAVESTPAVAKIDPRSPVVVGDWLFLPNGELLATGAKWARSSFVFGDPEWRDYDFRVEMFERQTAPPSASHLNAERPMMAAVIVRADAAGRNYWWIDPGSVGPPNEYQLLPFADGEPAWGEAGRKLTPHRGPTQIGVWYEVLVRVRGDRVTLLIDGKEIASGENSRLARGRVGLATNDHGYAKWRRPEVRDPSGAVLWSGWPQPSFVRPAAAGVIAAARGTPRRVKVDARDPQWRGAVRVEKGSKVTVVAQGRWSMGWQEVDAAGHVGSAFPLIGQLEARLNGWPILIGTQSTFFATESGDLQLRMHDWDYRDNAKSIEALVTVEPPPAVLDPATPDGRSLAERAAPTDPRFRERREPPSADEATVARERVTALFANDLATAKTRGLKAALAERMAARGLGVLDDSALRHACLDAARRAAADSGSPTHFLAAAHRIADEFRVERWPVIADTLKLAADGLKADATNAPPADGPAANLAAPDAATLRRETLRWCRTLVAETIADDAPEAALSIAETAASLAGEANDEATKREAARASVLPARIAQSRAAAEARATLEADPGNAAAARTLGAWLYLFEEDVEAGRPHLLRSGDAALQTLVERETVAPDDAAGAIALAEAWLRSADAAPETEKPYHRLRARRWFFAASGQATGRDAQRCEQALAELEAEEPLQVRRRFRNTLGTTFVWCPPGEFRMGSPSLEPEREFVEGRPRERAHRVRLTRGFWIAQTETTQAEFAEVMGLNPSDATAAKARIEPPATVDRFPVESVDYATAYEFARRLSFAESREYRLPTEAEWEYACRVGTATPFSWGATADGREANLFGNAPYGVTEKGPSLGRPTAVGSYPANAWGLFDAHGNVAEWCADAFADAYPDDDFAIDPAGPPAGERRPRRGGAWSLGAAFGRSAARQGAAVNDRSASVGFRLVLETP